MLRLRSHEKYEITSTTLTQKEFTETHKKETSEQHSDIRTPKDVYTV